MAADLTLYAQSTGTCPWAFHAMVALAEKHLAYELEVVPVPIPAAQRAMLQDRAVIGNVPILVHADVWISESLAISEYLAERFPTPGNPRLFPADLVERARARQVMSMLRTSGAALRAERPTSSVFGRSSPVPLSDQGTQDAVELVRVAARLIKPGQTTLCTAWSIADTDLALALMRLIANADPVPGHLVEYARAQWDRASVRAYIGQLPGADLPPA